MADYRATASNLAQLAAGTVVLPLMRERGLEYAIGGMAALAKIVQLMREAGHNLQPIDPFVSQVRLVTRMAPIVVHVRDAGSLQRVERQLDHDRQPRPPFDAIEVHAHDPRVNGGMRTACFLKPLVMPIVEQAPEHPGAPARPTIWLKWSEVIAEQLVLAADAPDGSAGELAALMTMRWAFLLGIATDGVDDDRHVARAIGRAMVHVLVDERGLAVVHRWRAKFARDTLAGSASTWEWDMYGQKYVELERPAGMEALQLRRELRRQHDQVIEVLGVALRALQLHLLAQHIDNSLSKSVFEPIRRSRSERRAVLL